MKCPNCQSENTDAARFCSNCATALIVPQQPLPSSTTTVATPPEGLVTGSLFAGRYQVIEKLGQGGMGKVFRVLDIKLNEEIALKLIKPEIALDKNNLERFKNELKLVRKVAQKNVGRMFDLGEETGNHFITMEYVRGEDLKSFIKRVGQVPVRKSISIAKQVCEGLSEVHGLGIIHRDLKPSNIMIDREGNARILDFGIARSLQSQEMTAAGAIIGTLQYMSPEQLAGHKADERADIYSLGVILYEMLTGRVPFAGDTTLGVILKQQTQVPESPKQLNTHISEALNHVILRCLEVSKEKRFQKVDEVVAELEEIENALRQNEDTGSREAKTLKRFLSRRVRYRWAVTAMAVVILLIGAWFLGVKKLIHPNVVFDNHISMEFTVQGSGGVDLSAIEYLLLRSLSASTRWHIFVHEDILTYKKQTESKNLPLRPAMLTISGDIYPEFAGFEIRLALKVRNKTVREVFDCKGYSDFLMEQIDNIHTFLADQSEGIIRKVEGDRAAAEITTSNLDALDHFLKGEEAWNKLDSDTAFFEYRTALEHDPAFGLAHLRLADVLVFRSDREGAQTHLDEALGQRDRLIALDMSRVHALQARLDSKPSEERQHLGRLIEEFPFKKEYHYELGESYFHCGDAEEAIKHYEKALELDGRYSLAYNHIAFCYSWIGDHTRALENFQRYQELDNTANSYDSLASGYMFSGDHDRALAVLEEGIAISPTLDYLFGNRARNYILLGKLMRAEEAVRQQAEVTTREYTRINTNFWSAYIALLQGKKRDCLRFLDPVLTYYSQEAYSNRLDEAPNLPFWLAGVVAAEEGDSKKLEEMIEGFEQKIVRNAVSSTNYFPVFKFYIHLKILRGWLQKELSLVTESIEEGKRICHKMGYWGSLFNYPYFYNQYAEILLKMKLPDEAEALLLEANEYCRLYAATHLRLAEICLLRGDLERARLEYEQAEDLLSNADKNFILVSRLEKLEEGLS